MRHLIVLIVFSFVLIFYSCKECIETPINPVNTTFALSPEVLEYKMGDTIYFTSEVDKSALFSGNYSSISGVELSSVITCPELKADSFPYQFPGAKSFKHFIIDGTKSRLTNKDSIDLIDKNIVNFIYKGEKDRYFVKIGIIPLKVGIFAFSPFSLVITTNKDERCQDQAITEVTYRNDNNNYQLYDSILLIDSGPDNYRNRYTLIVKPK